MKIAFSFDGGMDGNDGIQQYLKSLGKELTEGGHEVHYLVPNLEKKPENVYGKIHQLSRSIRVRFNKNVMTIPTFADRQGIKKVLGNENFDIIWVSLIHIPTLSGVVIKEAHKNQTPLIGMFHIDASGKLERYGARILSTLQRKSLRRFDGILATSEASRSFAINHYGIKSEITISPNMVDVDSFKSAKPIKRKGEVLNLFFLGRLVQRKGCSEMLESIKHFKDKYSGKFIIRIGGDGPLRQSLESYVKENELEDQVEFLGYLSEDDKRIELKSCDIAIFPSLYGESFGIVLLEAMAAKKPLVLAGNNDGYTAVLGDKPELLFNPAVAKQLSDKLIQYSLPTKRNSLVSWQSNYVEGFDAKKVSKEVINQFDNVIIRSR